MGGAQGAGNDRVRHAMAAESQARASDEEARRRATAERNGPPDDDLARLALVNEAIWTLVSRRLGIEGDELRATVDEVRMARDRDGAPQTRPCPACGSVVPPTRARCQFCGVEVPGRRLFP